MSFFGYGEGDEFATKGFLRAELGLTKGGLRAELAAFKRSLTRWVLAMLAVHTVVVGAVFAFT